MEICNSREHEEVVYLGGMFSTCPACTALEKVGNLELRIDELEKEIKEHSCE